MKKKLLRRPREFAVVRFLANRFEILFVLRNFRIFRPFRMISTLFINFRLPETELSELKDLAVAR